MMVIAIAGFATANAQFKAGDKTLSGKLTNFNFGYIVGDNDYSAINVDLSVAGSYFVIDKLAVEAMLGITSSKYSVGDYSSDASTGFGFGIGARYYVWDALYAGLTYQGQKNTDQDLINLLNIEVGYDYYITDNVFFEPAVYFTKNLNDGGRSKFGLSIGIGVNF